jgi:hypothetical protein
LKILNYFGRLLNLKKNVFFLLFFALLVEVLMIADNLLVKWLVDYGNGYIAGTYLGEEILRIFSVILLAFFVLFYLGLYLDFCNYI